MDIRRAIYKIKESSAYIRTYSNATFVTHNPNDDIVIDFYEEYVEPEMIVVEYLDHSAEDQLNYPEEEIQINREKRCSITMNKNQALKLAQLILERYGGDGNDSN